MTTTANRLGQTAVALGNFDGLHLGHQRVLGLAHGSGLLPVAMVVHCPFTLLTQAAMTARLEQAGFTCAYLDFAKICHMDGPSFVQHVLKEQWNAGVVACGYNFHFGQGGRWNVTDLEALCARAGIRLLVADAVCTEQGAAISSTQIRSAVQAGDMERAAAMLGRLYGYQLPVVHGDARGRQLGFPTINQKLPESLTAPRFGVYASRTLVEGAWLPSMTNIGVRPTYRLDVPQSETHVLGCRGDLYGQDILVELITYLRPERRFSSLAEMQTQLSADLEQVKHIFQVREQD